MVGALIVLVSLGLLSAGGMAVWIDRTQRDAGYVTTGVHVFSTSGSALATEQIDLGSPGVGWLYSSILLGEVRIRVIPLSPDSPVFVGIAPSADVDRYLGGVSHALITNLWDESLQNVGGGTPGSAPGTQDFWVASTSGVGPQTLRWDPANGSWTVVVMNADGQPGIDVRTDLGARMPAVLWIAIGSLAAGVALAVGGALLIAGAVRRAGRTRQV